MLVDTSKLKRDKAFENEKVGVSFSIGQSDEQLSFYINDDEWGKKHHILWGTSSDRYNKSYDYANEKIRAFVQDKIDRWVMEEEEEVDRLREESIKNRKTREENELRKLMDSF